jgi:hypothetical protein
MRGPAISTQLIKRSLMYKKRRSQNRKFKKGFALCVHQIHFTVKQNCFLNRTHITTYGVLSVPKLIENLNSL